jgi:meromycolic acid (3R)-3-hydroxyacyl-[acyl-carrier protein] dehydratase HadAB
MTCNRRMFEQVVVGYDTYMQTEELFEQHRPIVAGDELTIDVDLTSVRRMAGRDLITVTNTFTDAAGERVHTLHTTVVGVTAADIDPAIKTAVQNAMMHDVDIFGIGEDDYHKTVRPEGEIRIADGGLTRTPGTASFDEVKVGDELPVRHARLTRGDLVNYAGVAGDANPIHWDEDIAKLVPGLPPPGRATLVRSPATRCGCRLRRSYRPNRAAISNSAARSSLWTRRPAPVLSWSPRSPPARRSLVWPR